MILYLLDSQGGFLAGTVGDVPVEGWAYAYPTSPYAVRARRDPCRVAREMVADVRDLHAAQSNLSTWRELVTHGVEVRS